MEQRTVQRGSMMQIIFLAVPPVPSQWDESPVSKELGNLVLDEIASFHS
jgi:hypothetical protein